MSSTRKCFRWWAVEYTHNPEFKFGFYMSREEERYVISLSFLFRYGYQLILSGILKSGDMDYK